MVRNLGATMFQFALLCGICCCCRQLWVCCGCSLARCCGYEDDGDIVDVAERSTSEYAQQITSQLAEITARLDAADDQRRQARMNGCAHEYAPHPSVRDHAINGGSGRSERQPGLLALLA